MKLLYDLECTQPNPTGKRHGGGKYAEVVFFRMLERGEEFSCFYDSRKWINPDVKQAIDGASIELYDLQDASLAGIIKEHEIERVYSALPVKGYECIDCEVVTTLHGLREIEIEYDKYFYKYKSNFSEVLKFSIKKYFHWWNIKRESNKIRKIYFRNNVSMVTVSNHSYSSIVNYFSEARGREIKVFYSPNTSMNSNADDCKVRFEPISNDIYILMVSGNRWEKNTLRGAIAFDQLISEGLLNNIRMKITGCTEETYKYKFKNVEAFDFLGYVSEEELDGLYRNCHLFLYPSLNEGFGYPPLEAMKYGVPVISSPFSAMSEILEGGVLFANPTDIGEIRNRILMMMDEDTHDRYSKQGRSRYDYISKKQEKDLDSLIDYIVK